MKDSYQNLLNAMEFISTNLHFI